MIKRLSVGLALDKGKGEGGADSVYATILYWQTRLYPPYIQIWMINILFLFFIGEYHVVYSYTNIYIQVV